MSKTAPVILFVPVSGRGGAGEYHRALAIAAALRQRWPDAHLRVLLNREAPYAAATPYPVTLLNDSPTRDVGAVVTAINEHQPDVVIFDNAGRVAQWRAARRIGASVVYISSRRTTRWKGFRPRRMRLLDEHWLIRPATLGGELTAWETFKLRWFGRMRIRFLATVFEEPDRVAAAQLMQRHGLEKGQFILVCAGGAGSFGDRINAPGMFLQAAVLIAAATARKVVAIGLGVDHVDAPGVTLLPRLRNAELVALLPEARVCVVNGGSLLVQALVMQAVCIAVPIAGDQPARIAACAAKGALLSVPLAAPAMCAKAVQLANDDALRQRLIDCAGALGLRNGAAEAVQAVEMLLSQKGTA
jgi:hypothetical protein